MRHWTRWTSFRVRRLRRDEEKVLLTDRNDCLSSGGDGSEFLDIHTQMERKHGL